MPLSIRSDIVSSLQAVRGDTQRRVEGLDRYRALKAIEQTIADFPGLDDLNRSLGDIRDRVQQQLDGTREFRALRTIERILPELSEVLVLLADESEPARNPVMAETPPADLASDTTPADGDGAVPLTQGAPIAVDPLDIEAVVFIERLDHAEDRPGSAADARSDAALDASDDSHARLEEREAQKTEGVPPESETAPHVPSLADSVAQLMAQTVVPPPRDPQPPSPIPEWIGNADAARPQASADRAA